MKLSSEAKLGLTLILSLFVLIWGINYLKSRNIFSSKYNLVAFYEEVNGLEESAFITMNGFKIGSVSHIEFDTGEEIPFTVQLELDKKYRLKKGSIAEIYSSDLLGTMALRIIASDGSSFYNDGDTIAGNIEYSMITSLMNDIKPITANLAAAIQTLDSTASAITSLVQDPSIDNTLNNLSQVSNGLREDFEDTGDIGLIIANLKEVTELIKAQSGAVVKSMQNIEDISTDLSSAHLDSLVAELTQTSKNLSLLTGTINSGEGTVGKLIHEDSLYDQLNILLFDLDSLIRDINADPKKYVSFSLFGK